jgi:hypothetical protein
LAHVLNDGKNFEFSGISLDTKNNKIKGKMTFDREGNLQKCSLDEFKVNGNLARINILHENSNMLCSIIGDRVDIGKIFPHRGEISKDMNASVYVDLKEAAISSAHKIRNAKGSFSIKNGRIVDGSCYGVIGEDTTLAMMAKNIEGTDDTVISMSGSDAGKFLKYLGVTNTVVGGNISLAIKSSSDAASSLTGSFEMSNFIVKNNPLLIKLISLSSTNWLPNSDDISVGFNSCTASFILDHEKIIIEKGKAISPTIGIYIDGCYDRMYDDCNINGIAVPMAIAINSQHSKEILVSYFFLTGPIGKLKVSANPLQYVFDDIIRERFDGALPKAQSSVGEVDMNRRDASFVDPFQMDCFEEKPAKKVPVQRSTDNKYGVKITRGVKSD